jgi:hypothetical protein
LNDLVVIANVPGIKKKNDLMMITNVPSIKKKVDGLQKLTLHLTQRKK